MPLELRAPGSAGRDMFGNGEDRNVTPKEIKQARKTLGLTARQLALLVGYRRAATVYDVESGRETASGSVKRLIRAYLDGYRPSDWPQQTTK